MLKGLFAGRQQRGDTIIEVLFAVTVFSLVAVGALSIMNQGSSIAERSLETTLVRAQVAGQVSALQFLHDAYITAYTGNATKIAANPTGTPAERWRYIVDDKTVAAATNFNQAVSSSCQLPTSSQAFAINPASMAISTIAPAQAVVYSKINDSGAAEGLWIEAVGPSSSADGSNTRFVEFYVRACWSSVGQSVPMTLSTIVRLYEPAK